MHFDGVLGQPQLMRNLLVQKGVVAQMPVAAEVGSGDERDELEVPHNELEGLQRSVEGAR